MEGLIRGSWAQYRHSQLVMRGLDPRIHHKNAFEKGWIAGSSPAMTAGVIV
jgi:hypothetical protein